MFGNSSPSLAHFVQTLQGSQAAEQNGLAPALCSCDEVHAPVDTVTSVYINMAASQEHRYVASPRTTITVACWVAFVVCLKFHQPAADTTNVKLCTQQFRGSLKGGQVKNVFKGWVHGPNYRNLWAPGASTQ